ncbi:MAG TPA: aminotransferase class V-fold PLP-dependent enzyme [Candidatus Polarisedimenticolia bacterium]|nr:aminotransferase class V-fold PLP-dependent enzyme [Candidatus Polarisedimenticolia bacterium]
MGDLHGEVRRAFPALERDLTGGRRVYLNSGGGTLVTERSVVAMERTARYANAQDGEVSAGERATAAIHARARAGAADFLNASSPGEIAFHLSTSHALFNLSFAFRDLLRPGDNLVVTRLDHAANVSPWESLWGEDRGLEVRECGLLRDGRLDLDHLERLIDRKTRLVAVTYASNGLGAIVPIEEVVRLAHRHGRPDPPARPGRRWDGALVVVDAVHHAYHGPIDVRAIGCDFLAFSGYKLFGPMLGVLWGRAGWLRALRPYRVEPNVDEAPYKFEQGTPNHAVLAGLSGALDYLLWLGEKVEAAAAGRPEAQALGARLEHDHPQDDRRRLKWALCAIREHERTLSLALLDGFRALARRGVILHGVNDPARVAERDPTFLFEVGGLTQDQVKRRLWEEGRIEVPSGTYYSLAVYREMRARSHHLVRASFAHYDSLETVRHFLATLGRIAG